MGFERAWTAEILKSAPLIAPARSYVWPMRIAGEEDALARGAVNVIVRPASGGSYLVTAALGFKDPSMPTGVHGCPNPDELCVLSGGYAYVGSASAPEEVTLLGMKPVVQALECVEAAVLAFVGFTSVVGWGADGQAWETKRLSWEGLRVVGAEDGVLRGFGWDLMKDVEVEFAVNLRTGESTGGGYRVR
jgi:hypothetical protein